MKQPIINSEERLNNPEIDFWEYFYQFATKQTIVALVFYIGLERIKKSKCEYFNDIPIKLWDNLPYYANMDLIRRVGETSSDSTKVCTYKAVATKVRNGDLYE